MALERDQLWERLRPGFREELAKLKAAGVTAAGHPARRGQFQTMTSPSWDDEIVVEAEQ